MIMCRALSYEENTLDKSRLKKQCWRTSPHGRALQTLSISQTMALAAPALTAPDFWQ